MISQIYWCVFECWIQLTGKGLAPPSLFIDNIFILLFSPGGDPVIAAPQGLGQGHLPTSGTDPGSLACKEGA